jgi:uncharacterized protein
MLLLDGRTDDGAATSPAGAPTVVYSPSDLSLAATCELALLRALDAKLGLVPPLDPEPDAMLDRLAELGDRHERRVLAELRRRYGPRDPATGRGVVEIARPARADARDAAVLTAKRDETLAALRAGADAVFQAGFFDGRFSGWADFVVRADDPLATGVPSEGWTRPDGPPTAWAVLDTKLARRAKVVALLQLAAYADQLLAHGVPLTEHVHLVLGDHQVTVHRLADLLPAYRERRARLQSIVDAHVADGVAVAFGDDRYRACLRCEVCAPELEARRDVLLVAGLRVSQRARLRAAGVTTIDELAASTGHVDGIAASTLADLRAQARLQVAQERAAEAAEAPADGAPADGAPDPEVTTAGGVAYRLVAPDAVGHLPPPDPGDVFFDFEGDPLWVDEAGTWGLEYLFGVLEAPTAPGAEPVFRPFWAHDRAQERQALLDFLAYLRERRAAHPGMHVYHYASYEKAALLRLAGRYGVGEDEVDQLLRDGVLVDLYATVRASLKVGQRSYSLKKLEPLYMPQARTGEVTTAGESVVEYAEACEVRDQGRLGEWQDRLARIAEYNRIDCESTWRLRDWLLARAAEAGVEPRGPDREPAGDGASRGHVPAGADASGPLAAADAGSARTAPDAEGEAPDELASRLLAWAGEDPAERDADRQAVAMLAAALGYHEREAKPFWWAHYDRLASHPTEWLDRRSVLLVDGAEVVTDWHVPERAHTLQRHVRLVGRLEPGSGVAEGADVTAIYDPPLPPGLSTSARGTRGWTDKVRVLEVTAEGGGAARDVVVVCERLGKGATDADRRDALPMALAPGVPPRSDSIRAAVRALGERVAEALSGAQGPGTLPDQPGLDLLRRRPPRTRSGGLPPVVDGDDAAAITAAVADLDGSYLAVQGPPGTGKTYTGARVVAALVARGWRVGVVAQSHTVVENMLREVGAAGVPRERIWKKPKATGDLPQVPWTWVRGDRFADVHAAIADGGVMGGTAWDFTNPRRLPSEPFDLLVVDEAGQFALADTLAVSGAARNLLLLGDPQQLPQVTQGRHPEPVDCSALGWLVDGRDTLPPELGYFLARTWRMHPALARVVSRLSYEDRLAAVPRTAARSLEGVPPGVGQVLVPHEGNAVASQEEADEVVRQVRGVLGRTWTDPAARPPTDTGRPLEQADVVVVAPYNAQVWTIRRALDAAGLADVRVGTVDLFQGQQAVVVVVSMTASSPADVPRGMEFLLNRNRINVAISRAQWRAVVVRSPGLTDYLPTTPHGLAELGAFLGVAQGGD